VEVLNPLSLPADVVAALRSVLTIERLVDDGVRRLERRMASLPSDIEVRLRDHFDRQRAGISALHTELVANREQAEKLPPLVHTLRDEIARTRESVDALRAELRAVLSEIAEVRETVEPLQGPAERVARLSEKLPGGD
jgi:chromosome segregation ATPase